MEATKARRHDPRTANHEPRTTDFARFPRSLTHSLAPNYYSSLFALFCLKSLTLVGGQDSCGAGLVEVKHYLLVKLLVVVFSAVSLWTRVRGVGGF